MWAFRSSANVHQIAFATAQHSTSPEPNPDTRTFEVAQLDPQDLATDVLGQLLHELDLTWVSAKRQRLLEAPRAHLYGAAFWRQCSCSSAISLAGSSLPLVSCSWYSAESVTKALTIGTTSDCQPSFRAHLGPLRIGRGDGGRLEHGGMRLERRLDLEPAGSASNECDDVRADAVAR